jgi:hypothetical protein
LRAKDLRAKDCGKSSQAEGPAVVVASTAVTNRNERKSRTTGATGEPKRDSVLKLADYEKSDIIQVASNGWPIKSPLSEANVCVAYPGPQEIFPSVDCMRRNKRHARTRSGEAFSDPFVFLGIVAIIAAFVLGAFQVSMWIVVAVGGAIMVGPFLLLYVALMLAEVKDRMLGKRSPRGNGKNGQE